jgi:hypothetical protein
MIVAVVEKDDIQRVNGQEKVHVTFSPSPLKTNSGPIIPLSLSLSLSLSSLFLFFPL